MKPEQLVQLPLDRIVCRKQMREHFDDESIASLAATLLSIGQQVPIRVYRDGEKYVLVDGERRLRAARKAGLTSISAIVDERPLTSPELQERQFLSNSQRVDPSAIEKARAIASLVKETGASASDAASRLGMSPASVSRLLSLLNLPAPIIADLENGRISASTAYEIAKVDDPTRQAEMAIEAAEGRLTRDAASVAVRRAKRSPSSGATVRRAAICLEEGRSVIVQGGSLDYEDFIALCESAMSKAKKARSQRLTFQTFLKVARDQAKK